MSTIEARPPSDTPQESSHATDDDRETSEAPDKKELQSLYEENLEIGLKM